MNTYLFIVIVGYSRRQF